jgi:hypothetical protein
MDAAHLENSGGYEGTDAVKVIRKVEKREDGELTVVCPENCPEPW